MSVQVSRCRSLPRLFGDFLSFGFFTFGGGWSIIAQMRELYVEKLHILSSEELLDIASVSRSIPGAMVANVAMLFGYRCAGIPGGFLCLLGLALPPLAILSLITFFYTEFRASFWAAAAMRGIRAAVVPIMISAAAALAKGAFPCVPCVAAALAVFVLYLFFHVGCIWLVLLGAVFGWALSEYRLRKEALRP